MREGKDSTPIAYDGYTVAFPLKQPLWAIDRIGISDKLNALDGTVKREVGVFTFESGASINLGIYEGVSCLYVNLTRKAAPGSIVTSVYFDTNSYFGADKTITINPEGDKVFFCPPTDVSTEEFESELINQGVNFLYTLAEPYMENSDVTLPNIISPGTHYIEACSAKDAYIRAVYKS